MRNSWSKKVFRLKYALPPRGKCKICGENAYGYHHIVPVTSGGSGGNANKILLCERCHDIAEEMTDKGELLTPRAMDLIRLQISENKIGYKI